MCNSFFLILDFKGTLFKPHVNPHCVLCVPFFSQTLLNGYLFISFFKIPLLYLRSMQQISLKHTFLSNMLTKRKNGIFVDDPRHLFSAQDVQRIFVTEIRRAVLLKPVTFKTFSMYLWADDNCRDQYFGMQWRPMDLNKQVLFFLLKFC